MAIGLLGSALAGAVQGGAQADINNTAEANKQTEAMNLKSQEAAVNDLYARRAQERQFEMAGRYRTGVVMPALQEEVPKLLAAQKMVETPDQLTAAQKADGWTVASLSDLASAHAIALNKAGIGADEAQKGGLGIINAADRNQALIEASTFRGEKAAETSASAKNHATDVGAETAKDKIASQERVASARLGTLTAGQAALIIRDPLAPPDAVAVARKVLTSQPTGLLGGNAPSSNAPSNNLDTLFPTRN